VSEDAIDSKDRYYIELRRSERERVWVTVVAIVYFLHFLPSTIQ
jgi:hypothetical protein